MRVMSFNIRTLTKVDGPNQWQFRRDAMGEMLRSVSPDVIGFQEVQKPQLDDLVERLPGYGWYGVGRDDGREAGEYGLVFYRRERFDLTQSGTFWLCEDAAKPALGWDAACVRCASWATLSDKTDGRELVFINTHLDHMGERAREQGAKLIAARVASLAAGRPAVVTGDFNCGPESPGYTAMLAAGLQDARIAAAETAGPRETYIGWPGEDRRPILIDYVFTSPGLAVRSYEVLDEHWAGRQTSDHRAVVVGIE